MKAAFCSLLVLSVCCCFAADEDSLIPLRLNTLLPLIQPGMSAADVEKILAKAYPHLTRNLSQDRPNPDWKIDFKLDPHLEISISSKTVDGRDVTGGGPTFTVFDWVGRTRVLIDRSHWQPGDIPDHR